MKPQELYLFSSFSKLVSTIVIVLFGVNLAQAQCSLTTSGDVTICSGQSTTMSAVASPASGSGAYTWNGGSHYGPTWTVSPTTTTTYTVQYNDGFGCTVDKAITVTVSDPTAVSYTHLTLPTKRSV